MRFKRFLSIEETSRTDCFTLFANIRISSIGSTKADESINILSLSLMNKTKEKMPVESRTIST